jgi:hypothetical protein
MTFKRLRRFNLSLVAFLCLSCSAIGQKPKAAPDMELPLSTDQTAAAIGLKPLFDRMKQLSAEPSESNRWETLFLRQEVLLQVTAASLQVDAAADQVASEIAEAKELESYLGAQRDSRVDRVNLVSLAIGGIAGTASSALGLTVHDRASAVTGIVAGSATAVLSLIGLKLSRGGSHELLAQSNMLSEVFARPQDENNVYPPVVVSFMNAIAPEDVDGLTRKERLVRSWVDIGRIPDPNSEKGQEKINHLVSLSGQKVTQSIADLDDRQAMLFDLQVRLNYMKRDLATLLASIPVMTVMPGTNAPALPQ